MVEASSHALTSHLLLDLLGRIQPILQERAQAFRAAFVCLTHGKFTTRCLCFLFLRSLTNCMVSSSKPLRMFNRRKAAHSSDSPASCSDPAGRAECKSVCVCVFVVVFFLISCSPFGLASSSAAFSTVQS